MTSATPCDGRQPTTKGNGAASQPNLHISVARPGPTWGPCRAQMPDALAPNGADLTVGLNRAPDADSPQAIAAQYYDMDLGGFAMYSSSSQGVHAKYLHRASTLSVVVL